MQLYRATREFASNQRLTQRVHLSGGKRYVPQHSDAICFMLKLIQITGKDVRCFFCPTCTSHIYHHQDAMPDKIIVRTLLLDGGNDFPAGGEIFPEGKLAWAEDLRQSLRAAE